MWQRKATNEETLSFPCDSQQPHRSFFFLKKRKYTCLSLYRVMYSVYLALALAQLRCTNIFYLFL